MKKIPYVLLLMSWFVVFQSAHAFVVSVWRKHPVPLTIPLGVPQRIDFPVPIEQIDCATCSAEQLQLTVNETRLTVRMLKPVTNQLLKVNLANHTQVRFKIFANQATGAALPITIKQPLHPAHCLPMGPVKWCDTWLFPLRF